jgi:hypothetical protein
VRFGDVDARRFELADGQGKALDLRVPDLGEQGSCGALELRLESRSREPAARAVVFFPRLEVTSDHRRR